MQLEEPHKILLVEDNPSVCSSLDSLLSARRYRVVKSRTGLEAVNFLKKESVDLVLTDIAMPDMNGLELLAFIQIQWPDIPVVLMTAYINQYSEDRMRVLGANGFIRKPFFMTSLQKTLFSAFNNHTKNQMP